MIPICVLLQVDNVPHRKSDRESQVLGNVHCFSLFEMKFFFILFFIIMTILSNNSKMNNAHTFLMQNMAILISTVITQNTE